MSCNHVVLKWNNTNPSGISVTRAEVMRLYLKAFGSAEFPSITPLDSTSDFVGTIIAPNDTDEAYQTAVAALRTRFTNLTITLV